MVSRQRREQLHDITFSAPTPEVAVNYEQMRVVYPAHCDFAELNNVFKAFLLTQPILPPIGSFGVPIEQLFDYNGKVYRGTMERTRMRDQNGLWNNRLSIRLPNDGFLYTRKEDLEAGSLKKEGLPYRHGSMLWSELQESEVAKFTMLDDFCLAYLSVRDITAENVTLRIFYNYNEDRLDFEVAKPRRDGSVEMCEVSFEPAFPDSDWEIIREWRNNPHPQRETGQTGIR